MRAWFVLAAAGLLGLCSSARALTQGQIDTFQDGTTQNWSGGASPTNIANGGPAGAGDRFLQLTTFGSNMASYNLTQWSGNYSAAGITDVDVDLMDLPTSGGAASIRVVLFGPTGSRWTSNTAFAVPADGVWRHTTFSLREADLTNVLPTADTYAQTIAAVDRLMFRHDDGPPTSGGTGFTGSIGIDNPRALPTPEPASLALLAASTLILRRRTR